MVNLFSKLSFRSLSGNKLVLAGAAVATSAVIGTAGVAAAQSWHHWQWHHHNHGSAAVVRFCKEHYQDIGFKNLGQCVSAFNHGHGHGYGYGGGHHHHHGNDNNQGDDNNQGNEG